MPVRREIDKSRRLITQIAEGNVTFSEIQENRKSMLKDPDFDPSFDMLWDGRMATSVNLSGAQVRVLAESRLLHNTSRVAFVTPESTVFGVARMFETYYSMIDNPARTCVFRDLAQALEWLQQPRLDAPQDRQ